MNLEESNNAYNDPDVYRILSTISEFSEKKKAKKSHWSGYLPMLEFLEMSKQMPWQKLLCCFYLLLTSLLSYSSSYTEDINKILLLTLVVKKDWFV